MSEYDPAFGSSEPPSEEDLEQAREAFERAARPYLDSPWPWLTWAAVLAAAAIVTPRVLQAFGPAGTLLHWSFAILIGGTVELLAIRRRRSRLASNTLASWVFRAQGNLSLVAVALSLTLLVHAPDLAGLLPGVWLLLLGHSLFALGGLAFRPLRKAGLLYQAGGLVSLFLAVSPLEGELPAFAATVAIANLGVAWALGRRARALGALLMALALFPHYARAMNDTELLVAISPDIPPYVMDDAKRGLEIDIVRSALEGHRLEFVQMPYEELQSAIVDGRAGVSVGVQQADDGVYYSGNFITFANFAISRQADGLEIDEIADLAGHRVLTWQNADLELGEAFQELFSPQGGNRENYIEVADQEEQVRRFWSEGGDVVVIDRSIFEHFSRELGHSPHGAAYHPLFPPVTHFKVAFRDAELRDAFDRGVTELCRSGAYEALLTKYEIQLVATICDDRS